MARNQFLMRDISTPSFNVGNDPETLAFLEVEKQVEEEMSRVS